MKTAVILLSFFLLRLFTGYPIYDASSVALKVVRKWLEFEDQEGKKNADLVCILAQ